MLPTKVTLSPTQKITMDKVKLISVASYPISCISKEDKQFIGLSAYYVIMHFPQYKISFIFATDASDYAIGGVLSQVQDGQEKVIAYGSRPLQQSKQNYFSIEWKVLAVVSTVKELYRFY